MPEDVATPVEVSSNKQNAKSSKSWNRTITVSTVFCIFIFAIAIGLGVGLGLHVQPAAPVVATIVTATLAIPGLTCGALSYNAGGVQTALLGAVANAAGVSNTTVQPFSCGGSSIPSRRMLQANYENSCAAMRESPPLIDMLVTISVPCVGISNVCGTAVVANLDRNMYNANAANSSLSSVFSLIFECVGIAYDPALSIIGVPLPAINVSLTNAGGGSLPSISSTPSFVVSVTQTPAATMSSTPSFSVTMTQTPAATVAEVTSSVSGSSSQSYSSSCSVMGSSATTGTVTPSQSTTPSPSSSASTIVASVSVSSTVSPSTIIPCAGEDESCAILPCCTNYVPPLYCVGGYCTPL